MDVVKFIFRFIFVLFLHFYFFIVIFGLMISIFGGNIEFFSFFVLVVHLYIYIYALNKTNMLKLINEDKINLKRKSDVEVDNLEEVVEKLPKTENIKVKEKIRAVEKKMSESEIMIKILELDECFSKEKFESFCESIFMLVMNAFSNNDYEKLKIHETDELYKHHKSEIEDCMRQGIKIVRSMISIKSCIFSDFKIIDNKCYLSVIVNANLKDYIVNDEDVVIVGSSYSYYNKKYLLKFVRDVDIKTTSKLNVNNCPKCGAVIKADNDDSCKYCGSSLIKGVSSWSLCEIYEKK